MTTDPFSEWAGSYVLGALNAEDRVTFEAHLESCPSCKRDVMEFSALPGLLALIDEHDLDEPPAAILEGATAIVTADSPLERRRTRRWQLATLVAGAAAAVLAAVLVFGGDSDEPSTEAGPPPGAFATEEELELGSDEGVTGTIGLSPQPWGTFILIDLFGVPERDDYTLWTVSADGDWTSVANWVWSESGTCRIPAASGLRLGEIDRVVVTGAADKADRLAWGT